MTNKFYRPLILVIVCLIAVRVSAHQPEFINDKSWVKVMEPEISKAYYGFLPNQSVKYIISTTSPFTLYLGLLIPDLPDLSKNLSVFVVYQDGTVVASLLGEKFVWNRWYEEFGGDWYLRGPEIEKNVPAGTYTVIVSSLDNDWDKYVLAIGNKESFSIFDFSRVEKELYQIKTDFFEKPWYSIFEGKIGHYLLIFIILFVFLFLSGPTLVSIFKDKIKRHKHNF